MAPFGDGRRGAAARRHRRMDWMGPAASRAIARDLEGALRLPRERRAAPVTAGAPMAAADGLEGTGGKRGRTGWKGQ
jgi:hypothetical protein